MKKREKRGTRRGNKTVKDLPAKAARAVKGGFGTVEHTTQSSGTGSSGGPLLAGWNTLGNVKL